MPAGRPTRCTQFFKDMARHYIENYQEYDDIIPSIAGLSRAAKVPRSLLHAWKAEGHDAEFSDIYDDLMAEQERALLAGGLSKRFSGAISALVLTKHGYTNKTDLTNSDGSLAKPVTEIRRSVITPENKK